MTKQDQAKQLISDYDKKYATKHGMSVHLHTMSVMRELLKLVEKK